MRFMSMPEKKILAGVIKFQKKNCGNRAFLRKKSPSIVLLLTAFLSYCS